MTWASQPLRRVAPPQASAHRFDDEEEVWHLNLDQIESHTGRIVGRKLGPASAAGSSTFVFDTGNVLYSKLRPYLNKVVRPAGAGIATTELVPLRPIPGVLDPDFLSYFLRSPQFVAFASACVAGVKMPRVIMDKLWQHPVPLPPPSEQRRVVELLDQADALRRLRGEAHAKADRILPALFLKVFGDPATNPKAWRQRPLSEFGDIETGNTPSRKVPGYYGDDIEWIKSDNINTPSHFLTQASESLSVSGRRAGRTTPKGSTLVTCIAGSPDCIGNAALAEREVAFNQQINAVAPRDGIDPFFLYAQFVVGKPLIQAASTGAMKGMVSKGRFSSILFLDPPPDLQAHFGAQCAQLCDRLEAQRRVAATLEALFAALLHRAFSGALTSSWREAHLRELLQEMEQQARCLAARASQEAGA